MSDLGNRIRAANKAIKLAAPGSMVIRWYLDRGVPTRASGTIELEAGAKWMRARKRRGITAWLELVN